MSKPNPETYTAAEVAARFGVAEATILRNAAAGTLPFGCVRIGRRIRFPRSSVDAALGLTGTIPTDDSELARGVRAGLAQGLTVNRGGVAVPVRG